MADILTKIETYKREEIAAAKRARPLSEVEAAAKAAPPRAASPPRSRTALARGDYALIAEIKKASPSKGLIRADFDPPALARAYEAGGATCLSVLTDTPSFQGSLGLPGRRARGGLAAGAAQGFHVRHLSGGRSARAWRRLHPDHHGGARRCDGEGHRGRSLALGMDVLLEVHDRAELDRALKLRSPLLGVNNRNLRTFETTLATSEQLAPLIPKDRIAVGESGIFTPADLDAACARRHVDLPRRRKPDAPGGRGRRDPHAAGAQRAATRHRNALGDGAASPQQSSDRLTHIDAKGEARMVDVSPKPATERDRGRRRHRRHAEGHARSDRRRQRQEGRRARHRAHRRDHGGEANPRVDPALPSAAAVEGRGRHRDRQEASRLPRARDGEGLRPNRRRDGGAHRRLGRLPDDLRHGEGRRSRHPHRGHPPDREEGRQVRTLQGARSRRHGADAGRRRAEAPCWMAPPAWPKNRSRWSEARGRVLARDVAGIAHAAARRHVGDGRLRRPRRRRDIIGEAEGRSAKSPPVGRSAAPCSVAKPCASSPAA